MRKNPEKRLEEIAEAAIDQFSETGFRQTQMADVARRAGVSVGTLYLYVESKEALLHLGAVRVTGGALADLTLPLKIRFPDHTMALVREAAERTAQWPVLEKALAGSAPTDADFTAVGEEFYDLLSGASRAIRLLDRLALDFEEFDSIHAEMARGRYVSDLAKLLEKCGGSRPHQELRLIARNANELVAWSAMRRGRESPVHGFGELSEKAARQTTIACFAAVLATARQS